MLAAVRSAAVLGIDAYAVAVEVDAAKGLPQFTLVGLGAGAVKESRERVAAALANAGFLLPPRRLTVNLHLGRNSFRASCRRAALPTLPCGSAARTRLGQWARPANAGTARHG